jgi:hypothetical protein
MSEKKSNQPAAPVALPAPAPAPAILIDGLHTKGAKPRFQPGESVRCRVIGRDAKTGAPKVAIRLDARLSTDCIATVREYLAGDIGKYACDLAPVAPETVKA